MDGLKRKYTEDEKKTFLKIDPLFKYELNYRKSNVNMCTNRYFVESNGNYKICNISKSVLGNIYDENDSFINTDNRICKNKICSCFLAYGGRKDFDGEEFFIDYPIFRIAKE